MNVTKELLQIVEQAHSLGRILDAASRVIAKELRVDECIVFVLDEKGDPVRTGTVGAASAAGSEAEARAVAAQVIAERRAAAVRGRATSLLAAPMLLRDSMVIGAVVLQSSAARDFSVEDFG